jgi:hypothetical protein
MNLISLRVRFWKKKDNVGYLMLVGRIILKCILQRQDMTIWTGFTCHRKSNLWRALTFGFKKILLNS